MQALAEQFPLGPVRSQAQAQRPAAVQGHCQVLLNGHGSRRSQIGVLENTSDKSGANVLGLAGDILSLQQDLPFVNLENAGYSV